jgi:hypothetical protein
MKKKKKPEKTLVSIMCSNSVIHSKTTVATYGILFLKTDSGSFVL